MTTTMATQRPSQGHIVIFHHTDGPLPALVQNVDEQGTCNLAVARAAGWMFTHAPQAADASAPVEGEWTWPVVTAPETTTTENNPPANP